MWRDVCVVRWCYGCRVFIVSMDLFIMFFLVGCGVECAVVCRLYWVCVNR